MQKEHCEIVVYPDTDINEVYSIMRNLELESIPVAKTPWNRKIMGFISRKNLEKAYINS